METLLNEALKYYEFKQPYTEFLRHNENITYRIIDSKTRQKFVMRIHRSSDTFSMNIFGGSQFMEMLESEMNIINALKENTDIHMQTPIKNKQGKYVTKLRSGTLVTVLSWVEGKSIDQIKVSRQILYGIGEMIGKVHIFFQNWEEKNQQIRYYYDQQLVWKLSDRMMEIYKQKILTEEQNVLVQKTLGEVLYHMKELDFTEGSKGLTHTDLSKSNMLLTGSGIIPIDFCLSGYSYYYMDLGSVCNYFTNRNDRYYIFKGYETITKKPITSKYVGTFMAMQVLLYV